MGAIMKVKPAPDRGTTTAESLVRHLSTSVAEDDLQAVVSLLSDALDLAKARMLDARKTCASADEPCEPNYWFG